MTITQIQLSDLKVGHCKEAVVTRLLTFREATNVKRVESSWVESSWVDWVFLDGKEGGIYELSVFDVLRSNSHFKLLASPCSVRFDDQTKFVELAETTVFIPTDHFRFWKYEQLMALANRNVNLPDEYQACNGYNPTSRGATVCVSVFDYVADHLNKKLEQLLISRVITQIRAENNFNNV